MSIQGKTPSNKRRRKRKEKEANQEGEETQQMPPVRRICTPRIVTEESEFKEVCVKCLENKKGKKCSEK